MDQTFYAIAGQCFQAGAVDAENRPMTIRIKSIEGNPVVILARVLGHNGLPIQQSDVALITCATFDRDAIARTADVTLDISECVYNTLQTSDPRWTQDQRGYNVAVPIDGAALANGQQFQIQITITPMDGPDFQIVAMIDQLPIYNVGGTGSGSDAT